MTQEHGSVLVSKREVTGERRLKALTDIFGANKCP